MDSETQDFLKSCGLEDLTEKFKEECIDHDALLAMSPGSSHSILQEIIPKAGPRIKFQKALQNYQKLFKSCEIDPVPKPNSPSTIEMDLVMQASTATLSRITSLTTPSGSKYSMNRQITGLDDTMAIQPYADDENFTLDEIVDPQDIHITQVKDDVMIEPGIIGPSTADAESEDKENLPNSKQQLDSHIKSSATSIVTSTIKSRSNDRVLSAGVKHDEKVFYNNIHSLNLEEILNQTITGKAILAVYKKQSRFGEKDRRQFVDLLMTYLLSQTDFAGQPFALKNSDFDDLANIIIKLFPNEDKEVYYVAPFTEGRVQKISKGKLVDSYRNRLRELRKIGVINTNKRKFESDDSQESNAISTNTKKSCIIHFEWLNHNTSPWPVVIEHWEASRPLRLQILRQEGGTVATFFNKWPVLKQPEGYTLVSLQDIIKCRLSQKLIFILKLVSVYKHKFGDDLQLYSTWPQISVKLEALMESQIKDKVYRSMLNDIKISDYNTDCRDATLMRLLPVVCPPTARVKAKGSKGVWKPSTAESINAFILHVKSTATLQEARQQKKNDAIARKITLRPYVIIVGPSLAEIEKSYVNVDDTLYSMETTLKAVGVCYKIFQILNVSYPPQCEQVWLFLQTHIYKRKTQWDKKLKSVLNLSASL